MVRGRVASLPIHLKSFIAAVLSKSKEIVTCCFAIRDTRFSWHIFSNRSVVSVISDVCVITEHLKAIVPCSLPGGLFLWPSLGVPNLAGFSFVDRFFLTSIFESDPVRPCRTLPRHISAMQGLGISKKKERRPRLHPTSSCDGCSCVHLTLCHSHQQHQNKNSSVSRRLSST